MNSHKSILNGFLIGISFCITCLTFGFIIIKAGWQNSSPAITNDSDLFVNGNGNLTANKWNNLVTQLNTVIPSGFIGAFNLQSCPTGWSEYTAAKGKFLRGADDGSGNDPDFATRSGGNGARKIGSTQTDQFKSHTHTLRGVVNAGSVRDVKVSQGNGNTDPAVNSLAVANGGSETRPSNVYVLYCIKN